MVSINMNLGSFDPVQQTCTLYASWSIADKDSSARDWVGIWNTEPSISKKPLYWIHAIGSTRMDTHCPPDGTDYWVAYVSETLTGTQKILAKTHFVNRPQRSSLQCGTYNLAKSSPENVAQHAFATITGADNKVHQFKCDGGNTSKNNLTFPAELYKASISESSTGNKQEAVSLYAATGIAQFTTNPDLTAEASSKDISTLPPYAGLTYGFEGVCHQMCNRVMWAAAKPLGYTYANINYPPSLKASFMLYGLWGTSTSMLAGLSLAQAVMGSETGQEQLTDNVLHEMRIHGLQEHFKTSYSQASREPFHQAYFGTAIGIEAFSAYSGGERNAMVAEDLLFHALKRDVDISLLRGSISHSDYAGTINKLIADMLRAQAEVLTQEHAQQVYGYVPDEGSVYPLINEGHMPVDYVTIGKKLNL